MPLRISFEDARCVVALSRRRLRERRELLALAGMTLAGTVAAGCSSPAFVRPLSRAAVATASVVTASGTGTSITSTTVPTQVSPMPEGIYRTQLSVVDLGRSGVHDLSSAGTWTLTVKNDTYRLACIPITAPGRDCGNHNASMVDTVDIGTLRGSSTTVWFVHDMSRLVGITGCVRHAQSHRGCGGEGGCRMDWKGVPGGVAFTNFIGLGDEVTEPPVNKWTVHPWTRIS